MRRPTGAFLCAALAVLGSSVSADVTIEETMRIEAAGLMRMLNMTAHSTTSISGQRARTDTDLKMDSGLMRMFAGGPQGQIVLLDRDLLYMLDLKKKKYTETTLSAYRAKIEEGMAQMRQAQVSQRQATSGVDEAQCNWSAPTANVARTAEKATLAGYPAEHVIVTAAQSCTNQTNPAQVCEFRVTVDQWLTPTFPGGQEVLDYYQAYTQKLGLSLAGSTEFAQRVQSLFGGYQGIWNEVLTRTKELKGHPLKSSISLAVGGPQCTSTTQTAAPAQTPSATQTVGQAVGGALGGAIGGLFGKKKPQETATAAPPPPGGLVPILTVTSEILSASNAAANPAAFEVPANFKKQG